jgi:hypothetical protein
MARKSSRPIEDRLAQLEEQKKRMIANAAKSVAKSNPVLGNLYNALENYNKEAAKISRKMTGANSFENRRESARLKNVWIDAEEAYHIALSNNTDLARDYLDKQIGTFSAKITNGESVSQEMISQCLLTIPGDNLAPLERAMNDAETAWRDFVADNRSTKTPAASNTLENAAKDITGQTAAV